MARSNNRRKPGNTRPKGKRNYESKVEAKETKARDNDASWYVRNGQLVKDVASFSFNNALGSRITLKASGHDPAQNFLPDGNFAVPGIMTLHTIPVWGTTYEADTAPLNLSKVAVYSYVRYANSGHTNYDSPDLMLYLMAMDSIYSIHAFLTRMYGVARVFAQTNRYFGNALLTAMGVNPGTLYQNLADFRARINLLSHKISAFCVPNIMSMYARHTWMYSGLYRDEDIVKSQMYMYVPDFLFKYDEQNGQLVATPCCASISSSSNRYKLNVPIREYTWYLDLADQLLAPLVLSEDIGIMSGDILKAYGRENLWNLAQMPEDYYLVPAYSEEVLDQIHNTEFVGDVPCNRTGNRGSAQVIPAFSITQDKTVDGGQLRFNPCFANASTLAYDHILDMSDELPDPGRIMVATRNKVNARVRFSTTDSAYPDGVTSVAEITSAGSDLVTFAEVWKFDAINDMSLTSVRFGGAESHSSTMNIAGAGLTDYMKFNKPPILMLNNEEHWVPDGSAILTQPLIASELGNYTVISHSDLKKLHETALLSLTGVPVIGAPTK